jgi:hypothetical protein
MNGVSHLQRIKQIDTPTTDETIWCNHQMKNIHHPPLMKLRESEIKRRRLLQEYDAWHVGSISSEVEAYIVMHSALNLSTTLLVYEHVSRSEPYK